jgi:PIN domain nuclease of toxin-antitoxin system
VTVYLLDTHTLVWAVTAPELLGRKARKILEDPSQQRVASAVSLWEISVKYAQGKWPEASSFMDELQYQDHLKKLSATELLISSKHTRLAGQLVQSHKDPFDRLLAAQAILESIPLISKDESLDSFPIVRVW